MIAPDNGVLVLMWSYGARSLASTIVSPEMGDLQDGA